MNFVVLLWGVINGLIQDVVIALTSRAVFSAYVYYTLKPEYFARATSLVKAAALCSAVISSITGDLLVVEAAVSLRVLMIVSAAASALALAIALYLLYRLQSISSANPLADRDCSNQKSELNVIRNTGKATQPVGSL